MEELDSQIERTATDFIKLNELMEEKKAVEEKLEKKMERWEYLNELAEKIAAQS